MRKDVWPVSVQGAPATAPRHPWLWPDRPWDHIYINLVGPFLGWDFLLTVDAHSKWSEMRTTSATQTIQELRQIFAAYGLPRQVVSDNGP